VTIDQCILSAITLATSIVVIALMT